jgi:hypothetical protein
MAKRFMTMAWPCLDVSVRVLLLDDKAPKICESLWGALPYKSVQAHALITGYMMFATAPVFTVTRENISLMSDQRPGDCFYGAGSQNVVVVYGPLTEPEGACRFGQVVKEDIPLLGSVGRRVWENMIAPYGDLTLNPAAKQIIQVEYTRAQA